MIEETVIKYLNNQLDIPAYMEEPETKPDEYVVLQAIDNGRINLISAVTFNIRCYSTSLYKAAVRCQEVKNAMYDIVALDNVSSSKCGGGGEAIDSTTKRYAYDCIFNLYYMEE